MQTQAAAGLGTAARLGRTGSSWVKLLALGAVLVLAAPVIPMLAEGFEPFFALLMAPVLIGLVVLRFAPRVGVVWLGVVSLALLIMNAGFIPDALAHPESAVDFVPISMLTVGALVAVISTVPAFRVGGSTAGSKVPVITARIALAAVAMTVGTSLIASNQVTSDAPPGESTPVAIEDFSFGPSTISTASGEVLLFVTNSDAARHTFTIDELGVDVSIAPGQSKVIKFDASAGVYRFYCKPHEDGMEGEMVVG